MLFNFIGIFFLRFTFFSSEAALKFLNFKFIVYICVFR